MIIVVNVVIELFVACWVCFGFALAARLLFCLPCNYLGFGMFIVIDYSCLVWLLSVVDLLGICS